MNGKKLVTIIIPVHNEEENIPAVIDRLSNALCAQYKFDFEALFVDDGSTDSTLKMIEQSASKQIPVGYLKLAGNFGHQAALEAGLRHAKGDILITMDGDLQHPPEMIPAMLGEMDKGAEVVQMQRKNTGSDFKGVLSVMFYTFFRWISKVPIVPNAADFRLLTRDVVNEINKLPERGKLLRVLIPSLGYRQVHLPYEQDERKFGTPKYTFSASYDLAMHTIFKFSRFPANALYIAGFLAFLSGILLFTLCFFEVLPVSMLTVGIATLASLSGLLLLGCGVICRYLCFILEQVRSDPSFIVSKIVTPRNASTAD